MTRKSRLRKVLTLLITLAILGGVGYFGYRYFFKQQKAEEIAYQKLKVGKGEIHVTVLSTGTVGPENRLDIKPPVAGRVDELLVDEGYVVKKGQTLAWMSSTERAGLIDAASGNGAAAVKEWEALFKPTPILAPIAGTIIKKNVVAGQTFGTGDAVFTMSDHLIVLAQVDETDIGQIKLNQRAMITLDAYREVQTFGTVAKIAFDATIVNNVTTYLVYVRPDQVPEVMRSGMTANVVFDVETRKDILTIPNSAIKVKNGSSFVLLPKKDENQQEPPEQKIETGITDGKSIEVKSGLKEGDTILVPEFKLKESSSSANPFSPMSRPAPKKT